MISTRSKILPDIQYCLSVINTNNICYISCYPPGFTVDDTSSYLKLMGLDQDIRKRVIDQLQGFIQGVMNQVEYEREVVREVTIPYYGQIAAGKPLLIEDYLGETIKVPATSIKGPDNYYAVQVKGDSMIEANIFDGDIVILKAQSTAENGQIVAVYVEGEATLKKIYFRKNNIELQPCNCNSKLKPITVNKEEVRLQGLFIEVVRK